MKTLDGVVMDCSSHPKGGWSATVHFDNEVPVGMRLQPSPTPQADSLPVPTDWYEGITEKHFDLAIHKAVQRDRAARATADSQPAPDEATAMSRTRDLAEDGRWPSDWVEAYRRGYSDRAASATVDSVTAPAATVIKKGADRQWMSERLGHLPDGIYSLYLSPPTQAQAGAVPLTDEEVLDAFCHTPGIYQFVQAFRAGVRLAEQRHGIKGGQHGANN